MSTYSSSSRHDLRGHGHDHHTPQTTSTPQKARRVFCWYCHIKPCPSNKWLIHNILEKTYLENRSSLLRCYQIHSDHPYEEEEDTDDTQAVASWWSNPLESHPMLTYHSMHTFPRHITDWIEHHMLCRASPLLVASVTIRDYTLCVIEFPANEPTLHVPALHPEPPPPPRK